MSDSYNAAHAATRSPCSSARRPHPANPTSSRWSFRSRWVCSTTPATRVVARTLLLTDAEQSFEFDDVAERPVPSLLRSFSAPAKLSGMPLAQLQFLAAHDTDPFVRWESAQQYATHLLLAMAAAWRRGENIALDQGLIDAVAATLRDADADPAFAAEALALPSESFLADQMAVVDVDAIHAVRHALRARRSAARCVTRCGPPMNG